MPPACPQQRATAHTRGCGRGSSLSRALLMTVLQLLPEEPRHLFSVVSLGFNGK